MISASRPKIVMPPMKARPKATKKLTFFPSLEYNWIPIKHATIPANPSI
jgi:hypothetical protein